MGRAREPAACTCDVVWVLKGSGARRHPCPPRFRRRLPSDPRQEAASADRASPWEGQYRESVFVWAVYYKQIRKSEQRPPLHLRTADLVPERECFVY